MLRPQVPNMPDRIGSNAHYRSIAFINLRLHPSTFKRLMCKVVGGRGGDQAAPRVRAGAIHGCRSTASAEL